MLASLGLAPLAGSKASVVTAGGTLLASEFEASIWTVDANPNCLVTSLRVVGVAPFGCSALIGQDVLRLCELLHDGPGNAVPLTFPWQTLTDHCVRYADFAPLVTYNPLVPQPR